MEGAALTLLPPFSELEGTWYGGKSLKMKDIHAQGGWSLLYWEPPGQTAVFTAESPGWSIIQVYLRLIPALEA